MKKIVLGIAAFIGFALLVFKKSNKGNYLSRFFSQVSMLFNNLGKDGGLFIVIGKKNEK